MNFPQFAYNNIKRNSRAYFAYFLSSAFMVMIFFTYAVFIYHPDIAMSELGKTTQTGMKIAEYVIFVFSFLFVLYSISVFLKARNHEFGILTILGATSHQINRLIFLENMLIGCTAIMTGILSGLLLSKLFLLLSTRFVGMDELTFYWPLSAALLTTGAFLGLFLFISLFTLLFIRKNKVLELLTGSSKPKKEPKASILLSILAVALLGFGLNILVTKSMSMEMLLLAAGTGIMGTYFFYTQLSVLMIRLLKRSRRFVWKRTNLLWISEMAYKIKDNARMLFMVTVVTSVACMAAGFVLSIEEENSRQFKGNPFTLTYHDYSQTSSEERDLKDIDQFFQQAQLPYEKVTTERLYYGLDNSSNGDSIDFISLSDMRRLVDVVQGKDAQANEGSIELPQELGENTALYVQAPEPQIQPLTGQTQVSLEKINRTMQLEFLKLEEHSPQTAYNNLAIVADATYKEISAALTQNQSRGFLFKETDYLVRGWTTDQLPKEGDPEVIFINRLNDYWSDHNANDSGYFKARVRSYLDIKEGTSMISFIGVFIAAIFSISSASFLYFKLFAELGRDGKMYRALAKIGLSEKEMNRSATLQIAILFFTPTVVSTIQTLVVLRPILKSIGIMVSLTPVLTTSALFAAAQLLYFLVVRARYIMRLKKMMA